MQLLEVTINSELYTKGVNLRKQLFFEGLKNADALIRDPYENNSIHIIALVNHNVIGTGRLTFTKTTTIISQMTVVPGLQKAGVGSLILEYLVNLALKKTASIPLQLSARTTAIGFYAKFGFSSVGNIYPSVKTGILHQLMVYNKH